MHIAYLGKSRHGQFVDSCTSRPSHPHSRRWALMWSRLMGSGPPFHVWASPRQGHSQRCVSAVVMCEIVVMDVFPVVSARDYCYHVMSETSARCLLVSHGCASMHSRVRADRRPTRWGATLWTCRGLRLWPFQPSRHPAATLMVGGWLLSMRCVACIWGRLVC
jgi:hypothetical protein